ncbi:MAG: hypothetical protein FWG56_06650, partial [Desulfovibrionaceae bacterium]|nr:hypothetical protein [Desulfovibrionaceae bacterium]
MLWWLALALIGAAALVTVRGTRHHWQQYRLLQTLPAVHEGDIIFHTSRSAQSQGLFTLFSWRPQGSQRPQSRRASQPMLLHEQDAQRRVRP